MVSIGTVDGWSWGASACWRLCQREPVTKPSRQPPREPLQQLDVRLYDPQEPLQGRRVARRNSSAFGIAWPRLGRCQEPTRPHSGSAECGAKCPRCSEALDSQAPCPLFIGDEAARHFLEHLEQRISVQGSRTLEQRQSRFGLIAHLLNSLAVLRARCRV